MSTWFYLQCLNHDPQLRSHDESGQHYRDLPRIRAELTEHHTAEEWATLARHLHQQWQATGNRAFPPEAYFRMHTAAFLADHPDCTIGIIDEYGVYHPTKARADRATKALGRSNAEVGAMHSAIRRVNDDIAVLRTRAEKAEADVEMWRVAYQTLSDLLTWAEERANHAETTLDEIGDLVTAATQTGDDKHLLDALAAALERYQRDADRPTFREKESD